MQCVSRRVNKNDVHRVRAFFTGS